MSSSLKNSAPPSYRTYKKSSHNSSHLTWLYLHPRWMSFDLLISMPASSITSFNHRAMDHVLTIWSGDIKLKNKRSFCMTVSLWLAVSLRYVHKNWTRSKLFYDGIFKIWKAFLGLEIVLDLVIPRMWHISFSSNHNMACGLIACNSCPLALQTRAKNIANFRVSNIWLKHTVSPISCK